MAGTSIIALLLLVCSTEVFVAQDCNVSPEEVRAHKYLEKNQGETFNFDNFVDQLLDILRQNIVQKGRQQIQLPDIHEKAGFIKFKSHLDATEGWARDLSTIYRTAHVTASSQGSTLSFSCGIGIKDLEIGYRYKAKFMNIGPSGKIHIHISKNSILFKASLSLDRGTCKATLDYLRVDQLGGFKLKICGLGPLNTFLSNISDNLLKTHQGKIRKKIETSLGEEIEKQLKDFNCAQYLLGWL